MSSQSLNPNVTSDISVVVGPREIQIMRMLWQRGPATVRELRDCLALDPPLAYTTILTIHTTRTAEWM